VAPILFCMNAAHGNNPHFMCQIHPSQGWESTRQPGRLLWLAHQIRPIANRFKKLLILENLHASGTRLAPSNHWGSAFQAIPLVRTSGLRVVVYPRTVQQVKRWLKIVSGFTLLAAGIIMLVLPGPGWVVILAGLALLAAEYVWAQRLLQRIKAGGTRLRNAVRPSSKRSAVTPPDASLTAANLEAGPLDEPMQTSSEATPTAKD
jgi:hypothetical protein